ncbi:tensin-2 isoform X1 [Tachysurus ichikawai]
MQRFCPSTGLGKAGKGEPHEFKEKTFKKKRQCGVCKQNIESLGSFCRVCKTATHKKCESKVNLCVGASRTPPTCSTREWLIDKSLNAFSTMADLACRSLQHPAIRREYGEG